MSRYNQFHQQHSGRQKPMGFRRSSSARSAVPFRSVSPSTRDNTDDDDESTTTTTSTATTTIGDSNSVVPIPPRAPTGPIHVSLPSLPAASTDHHQHRRQTGTDAWVSEKPQMGDQEVSFDSLRKSILKKHQYSNLNGMAKPNLSMEQMIQKEIRHMQETAGKRVAEGIVLAMLDFFDNAQKQGQMFVRELSSLKLRSPKYQIAIAQRHLNTIKANLAATEIDAKKGGRLWGNVIKAMQASLSGPERSQEVVVNADTINQAADEKAPKVVINVDEDTDIAKRKKRKRKWREKKEHRTRKKRAKSTVPTTSTEGDTKQPEPKTGPDGASRHGMPWSRSEHKALKALCDKHPQMSVDDPRWDTVVHGRTRSAKYMRARTAGYWLPWTDQELEVLHQFCVNNPEVRKYDALWNLFLDDRGREEKTQKAQDMGWWDPDDVES